MSTLFNDFVEKNKDAYRKLRINNDSGYRASVRQPYKGGGPIHGPRRGAENTKSPQEQRRPDNSAFSKFNNVANSVAKFGNNIFGTARSALDRIQDNPQQSNQQSFAPLFGAEQQSLIDSLLNNEYMKPRSAEEISAFAREGADAELANLMGVLDQILGAAQSRYSQSDQNLESMYGAHQNDVRTNSLATQRDITKNASTATEEAANSAVGNLTEAQNEQNAQRAAMLRNLGIESAAAQPDEYNALAEAQGQIQQGNARSQNRINEIGAANEAATINMANAIGLEGAGQRSALERQFGQFGNEIDMQRAQYQQQHAEAMRNLLMQAEAMANQERQQYGQFQYGIGSDMLNSELDYVTGQALAQAEAAAAQAEFEQKMQLQDRKYELEGGLARSKQRSFDPLEAIFKARIGEEDADYNLILDEYLRAISGQR